MQQYRSLMTIPIDHYTDCRDLFQLVVGEKGIPQDRYQRLYILSLREDRIKGATRYFYWIPTLSMIVDALTKSMVSPFLYDLLTHGFWRMKCVSLQGQAQKPLVAMPLQIQHDYQEDDLIQINKAPRSRNYFAGVYSRRKGSHDCSEEIDLDPHISDKEIDTSIGLEDHDLDRRFVRSSVGDLFRGSVGTDTPLLTESKCSDAISSGTNQPKESHVVVVQAHTSHRTHHAPYLYSREIDLSSKQRCTPTSLRVV